MQASALLAASAAKSQLARMMNNGNLQAIFGDEIAGIPAETVLAITQAQVWAAAQTCD
jgi:orotate phosphoribosyltransferase